jgi:hypothetical protein
MICTRRKLELAAALIGFVRGLPPAATEGLRGIPIDEDPLAPQDGGADERGMALSALTKKNLEVILGGGEGGH